MTEYKLKTDNKEFYLVGGVLLLAFLIRIYYFITTKGQTLWWDEAEYMASAKHWAFDVPYNLNEQRPPIFQLMAAGLLKFGFEETALKFILVILPSTALVFVTYLLGKEMFGWKTGLIVAFGTGTVWSILFWTARFQPDFLSVTFQLLAFLFFWKFIKNENKKFAVYTGIFSAVAFYFKISALLVPLSIIIFALYYNGFKFLVKKNYWWMFSSFIIGLIPFMLWQIIAFGNPLAFGVSYSGDFNEGRELGWMTLEFYHIFLKSLTFGMFILGIVAVLGKITISLDIIYKDKQLRKDPSIFSLIILLVVTFFYIFYIKGTIEDRWVFLIIPFSFFFVAKTFMFLYEKIDHFSKLASISFVVIYVVIFTFTQLSHTTDIIQNKEMSYLPVKEAAMMIKSYSNQEDKILSVSYTQTVNYAEREVITYARMDLENFTRILHKEKPSFVMASIIEPNHPTWMVHQVQNEQGFKGIIFPYFNSSVIFSPEMEIVQYNIKKQISNELATFNLLYPYDNSFGGLLLYKVDYK